ncbi:MAG TPA: SOS response-associated peptidase [Allosphingosinicella sp.]|jgi:putative SOS response-associated peptidase YedK
MCNEVRRRVALGQIRDDFSQIRIPLRFPEGLPNLAPLESIRITDQNAIVRSGAEGAELVVRRWSWPGAGGKPVYNYRSEGREFTSGRCIIVVDGFYEFTKHSDQKSKRKHKWLFTLKGSDWFGIAGLVRNDEKVGEAFTMLTTEPGPDVAPYHSRQVAVLPQAEFGRWLDPAVPAREVLQPLPAGRLEVEQIC